MNKYSVFHMYYVILLHFPNSTGFYYPYEKYCKPDTFLVLAAKSFLSLIHSGAICYRLNFNVLIRIQHYYTCKVSSMKEPKAFYQPLTVAEFAVIQFKICS